MKKTLLTSALLFAVFIIILMNPSFCYADYTSGTVDQDKNGTSVVYVIDKLTPYVNGKKSSGNYTVSYNKNGLAKKAVNKLNSRPITTTYSYKGNNIVKAKTVEKGGIVESYYYEMTYKDGKLATSVLKGYSNEKSCKYTTDSYGNVKKATLIDKMPKSVVNGKIVSYYTNKYNYALSYNKKGLNTKTKVTGYKKDDLTYSFNKYGDLTLIKQARTSSNLPYKYKYSKGRASSVTVLGFITEKIHYKKMVVPNELLDKINNQQKCILTSRHNLWEQGSIAEII